MSKKKEVFVDYRLPYDDKGSNYFIHSNRFQKMTFPAEYPALILVHSEHPAMSVPLHWHPEPELIYSKNKQLLVLVDGERVQVEPGQFVLIGSYALHAIEPMKDGTVQDVMSVSFQAEYLERMMPELRNCVISRDAPGATEDSKTQLIQLCEQLRCQLERKNNFFEINRILFKMLHLIFQDFVAGMQNMQAKRGESKKLMVDILDYMEDHYQQPLTTKMVADHFGYTRAYFCRIFKLYGNQTFKQYLTDLRLSSAVQELVSTDKGVAEIALNHGFPDEKSFFGAFKRRYGTTPNQYRKQY